jgi:predicted  nucleic acid-binding Zn-ribbon protein
MLYFKTPMSETEVDEYIRTLIDDMAAYIATLDPTSQAYADAVQAYNDLIDQYNEMTQTLGDGSEELLRHYDALGAGAEDATPPIKNLGDEEDETKKSTDGLRGSVDDLRGALDDLRAHRNDGWEEYLNNFGDIFDQLPGLFEQAGTIQQTLDDLVLLRAETAASYAAQIAQARMSQEQLYAILEDLGNRNAGRAMAGDLYEISELLEEITGQSQRLRVAWGDATQNMIDDFGGFRSDVDAAIEAIEQINYFGIDLDTTDADESINALIFRMMDYLATLDPESQAYRDMQEAIADLIDQFTAMGGVLDEEAAVNWQADAADDYINEFQDLIDRLEAEAAAADIAIGIDIEAAQTALQEILDQIRELTDTIWEIPVTVVPDYSGLGGVGRHATSAAQISGNSKTGSESENISIVVNEATPNTWVEITDRKISPRIKYKERYMTNWTSAY